MDEDKILVGQEVRRSLNHESHDQNCDEHRSVEKEEHRKKEEVLCLLVRHIYSGVG